MARFSSFMTHLFSVKLFCQTTIGLFLGIFVVRHLVSYDDIIRDVL